MLPLLLAFVAIVAAASASMIFSVRTELPLGCLADGCTRSKIQKKFLTTASIAPNTMISACQDVYQVRGYMTCEAQLVRVQSASVGQKSKARGVLRAEDKRRRYSRVHGKRCKSMLLGVVNDNNEGSEKYCLWVMFMERYDQTD